MSLKVEQFLDEVFFTESQPKVFTTGAFVVPMRIKANGKERFVWVVEEFKDDSYFEGKLCTPLLYSDSLETMIENED